MKKSFQLTIYRVVARYVSKISVEILRQLISLKKLVQLLFVCAALDQLGQPLGLKRVTLVLDPAKL
jgi:hypothetical protein